MPASYRDQEVEVIVLKKAEAAPDEPVLTKEEKLAAIQKFKGMFSNSEWQPGSDFEDEMYTQE